MSEFKQYMETCCVCGDKKLCACAQVTPLPQTGSQPPKFVVAQLSPKQIERRIAQGASTADEYYICDACAEREGSAPKKLWTTWIVAWVLTAAGLAISAISGRSINPVGMALAAIGCWILLFTTLFLVVKAGLGGKGILLGFCAAFVPFIGLVALPLLRNRINHNEKIVTALKKWAEGPSGPRYASAQPVSQPAPTPFAPSVSAAPRTFAPYTGGGVCDVCNQSVSGRQAWIVPNDVFYGSPQYRQHLKNTMRMMGMTPTDADIERMRLMDHSQGSAVCENCIHMFK